jgi:hypothetical protein
MNRSQLVGFLVLFVGALVFLTAGLWITASTPLRFLDFKAYYYASRCFLSHSDPYKPAELEPAFLAAGGALPNDPPGVRAVVINFINFPTNILFTAPFALLSWHTAQLLWTSLTCACYFLACFLIWTVAAPRAPVLSAVLVGLLLASSQTIFAGGNAVGFVVSLTTIAAWCFIRGRFGWAGALCLAIALVLKPHDAGLVWLFFLLAGGAYRKRALQTLALAAVFAAIAFTWAFRVAPDWPREQRDNLAALSTHSGMNDPAPSAAVNRSAGVIVDLQSVLSVFHDDPAFYNPVAWTLCGIPLLAWARSVLHSAPSEVSAWVALAAIIPLTMLVTYHKPYDVKLLLLAVPACVLLWSEHSLRGQAALLLTLGSLFCTADIPLAVYAALTDRVQPDLHTLGGRFITVLVLRPVSLILIALTAFYLSIYLRRTLTPAARSPQSASA